MADATTEQLQIRIHGDASQPTLIFLPGMHGDWTLIGSFRRALDNRVRFVEFIYPRTLTWSLDDYATAVEEALVANGITTGWLLGESFGSQIVWPMLAHGKIDVQGVILAGGFAKHPMRWLARLAEKIAGCVSLRLLIKVIFGYAKIAKLRFRKSPETLAHIDEFVSRRTELDKQAATYRLHLVAQNDPSDIARQTRVPVYMLIGAIDPIVPWPWTRSWFRRNCPALRDCKIFWRADHNVLGTASGQSAEQVMKWMKTQETTC